MCEKKQTFRSVFLKTVLLSASVLSVATGAALAEPKPAGSVGLRAAVPVRAPAAPAPASAPAAAAPSTSPVPGAPVAAPATALVLEPVNQGETPQMGDIVLVQRPFGPWVLSCVEYIGHRRTCRINTVQTNRGAQGVDPAKPSDPLAIEFNTRADGAPLVFFVVAPPVSPKDPLTIEIGGQSVALTNPACIQQPAPGRCVYTVERKDLPQKIDAPFSVSWIANAPQPHRATVTVDPRGLQEATIAAHQMASPFPIVLAPQARPAAAQAPVAQPKASVEAAKDEKKKSSFWPF